MITMNSCGSSETIRKAPTFIFDDFYAYGHADHVPRLPESFLEWFIGFFEGDGSLSYTKEGTYNRLREGKAYKERVTERLRFNLVQKERAIIEKIAYSFGFGTVSSFNKDGNIYWRWTLESKEAIERMAFLLSGNLILENRQQQFSKWVEIGQKKGMFNTPFNINKPWSSQVALNNAWLSGFIDAEGCFYARFALTALQKEKRIKLPTDKKQWSKQDYQRFIELSRWKLPLSQKMTLTQFARPETNKFFKQILCLFEGTAVSVFQNKTIKKASEGSYVRIEFSSLASQKIISTYLFKYPLQTIKRVSFRRWWRVYLRREKKVHLTPKGTKRLYRLVKAINVHRKEFYTKYDSTEDQNKK
jgi:LAGLIDADG endonuclease